MYPDRVTCPHCEQIAHLWVARVGRAIIEMYLCRCGWERPAAEVAS